MNRCLVIACGNPLRGDDGVGRRIADALEEQDGHAVWAVESVHQLAPELAEAISLADAVIFVDASETAKEGVIEVVPVSITEQSISALSHTCTPVGLLRLARELYGKGPSRAYLVTIGARHFEYSERLSPSVVAAVQKVVAAIQEIAAGE